MPISLLMPHQRMNLLKVRPLTVQREEVKAARRKTSQPVRIRQVDGAAGDWEGAVKEENPRMRPTRSVIRGFKDVLGDQLPIHLSRSEK